MTRTSSTLRVALLAAFAVSLLFGGTSFAGEQCDPAACAAKCKAICQDTTLTQAERLEKCKEVCKEHGSKACMEHCKANCELYGTAKCPHGAKADASGESSIFQNASATTTECPHAKAMMKTAEASEAKPEADAKAAAVKSGCAKTCGAEAAKACAATKKACAMSSKEKEKPE